MSELAFTTKIPLAVMIAKSLATAFPYQFPIARHIRCFFCPNSVVSNNSFNTDDGVDIYSNQCNFL